MPQVQDLSTASFALATGLGLIALFLGLREWYERRARGDELSDADHAHFLRQDLRRLLGISVLAAIALLILAGSFIEVPPHRKPSLVFPILWIVVLTLIVALLVLALADLAATRQYARRHRKEIIRDSIESIRREAQEAASRAREGSGDRSGPGSD